MKLQTDSLKNSAVICKIQTGEVEKIPNNYELSPFTSTSPVRILQRKAELFKNEAHVNPKVILLRDDATETGRRMKFRELRRLRRWNKNVNRWPKAKLDG